MKRLHAKFTAVLLGLVLALGATSLAAAQALSPMTVQEPQGRALVERLRHGGIVLFFRHADTTGMPCDRTYRIGERAGQRNLSPEGREQSRRIGEVLRSLEIPVADPVLAGPVFRARDTAELAFGSDRVAVTDSLLADDYAGRRLEWVLGGHRRLLTEPVPAGVNRVLVGHRTPAIMVLGSRVGGEALPEGAALVIEPGNEPRVLGILLLAPIPDRGFHGC
ncbi:histidine phosphatase family protein [Microvirga roseola]|uniref:histidine phosphatase family protein n=1 Tax=Microvirga roseola TaxID=2883126 RepID=UPI001E363D06|nr:histidine phosphatase family protein [Microvirga roseola]